jgi:uncharacterized Zn ribbon protein
MMGVINSPWTRTCNRGHTYEGVAHFDYCPECYKEIPEWAKEIMRIKLMGENCCSGTNFSNGDGINITPRIGI